MTFGLLSVLLEIQIQSHKGEMSVLLFITSFFAASEFMLMKWLWESTYGWEETGCQGKQACD